MSSYTNELGVGSPVTRDLEARRIKFGRRRYDLYWDIIYRYLKALCVQDKPSISMYSHMTNTDNVGNSMGLPV